MLALRRLTGEQGSLDQLTFPQTVMPEKRVYH
jgi:hypothetical protein